MDVLTIVPYSIDEPRDHHRIEHEGPEYEKDRDQHRDKGNDDWCATHTTPPRQGTRAASRCRPSHEGCGAKLDTASGEPLNRCRSFPHASPASLAHRAPSDDTGVTEKMWADAARLHFNGRVIVGRDLMEI